jgi:hypothetical protein
MPKRPSPGHRAPPRATSEESAGNYAALIPGLDPYIDWALGAGRAHYFLPGRQNQWMPVFIELEGATVHDFVGAVGFFAESAESERDLWRGAVHVSPLYTHRSAASGPPSVFTAMVTEDFFRLLRRNPRSRQFIRNVKLGLPLNRESLPEFAHGRKSR